MLDNNDIGISYRISAPFNRRIAEIKEILEDEDLFKRKFHEYQLEFIRNGKSVTMQHYVNSILSEISKIYSGAIGYEKKTKRIL